MQNTVADKKPVFDITQVKRINYRREYELIAMCPVCKAIETIYFSGGQLISTRKFVQVNDYIFHDCNLSKPCRLYKTI